jgi:hypothetical protein
MLLVTCRKVDPVVILARNFFREIKLSQIKQHVRQIRQAMR